jgi:hypothetical protein
MTKYYIYLIKCKNLKIRDCYIGSTKDKIKRKSQHQYLSTIIDNKLYNTIRDNGNFECWEFIVLEEFETDNKFDCLKIERKYIELYKPNLNINLPSRLSQEWKQLKKPCPFCKMCYRIDNISHHNKSQKHLNNLNNDNIIII